MPNLTERLREAAGDPRGPSDFDALAREAGNRRSRRRRRTVALVAGAGLLVAVLVFVRRDDDHTAQRITTATTGTTVTTATTTPDGSLFSSATGDALVFDNGDDEITVLGVDSRRGEHRFNVGQRAGDQPFRMTRVNNDVLVGWGEVFAAPLAGGPSRSLGQATVYLPATEPDRVWLSEYPNENGVPPRVRLIEESTGRELANVASPQD